MSNVQIEVKAGLGSVNIFYNIVKYVNYQLVQDILFMAI